MGFVKIATVDKVAAGSCRVVQVDGKEVALFNVNGKYYALENTCPHQGGPLGDGALEDKTVTCPLHGWQFDVTTGENIGGAEINAKKYNTKIDGNDICIEV